MSTQPKLATKIMLIRHGEKPAKDDPPYGVTLGGIRSKESLEIRGWQRAGALTNLLGPDDDHFPNALLAKPEFLYASKPLRRKGSRRPLETLIPLADKLAVRVNSNYPRFEYKAMIDEVFGCKGVVLICWQREYIPEIASYILGDKIAPQNWPENCFDMIWVFDLDRASAKYTFGQVPQKLLGGDLDSPIK